MFYGSLVIINLLMNQLLIYQSTLLTPFANSVAMWLVTIILLLSANKTGVDTLDIVFGRSFMHRKKKTKQTKNLTLRKACLTNPHPEKVVLECLLSISTF
jgi:hypothetical protein